MNAKIIFPLTFACCALSSCVTGVDDASNRIEGADDDVGEPSAECVASEPEIPYNLDINCGDTLIPMIAAFNEKTDGLVAFAPHPDALGGCPFLVEGATINADAVENCLEITATAEDAETEGTKDTGKDRIQVSWCWYTDSGVECEDDHMTIRYSCDSSQASEHDSTWPLSGADCEADPDGGSNPDPDAEPDPDGEPTPDPDVDPTPDPAPECVQDSDCLTGEFCNEQGTCGAVID